MSPLPLLFVLALHRITHTFAFPFMNLNLSYFLKNTFPLVYRNTVQDFRYALDNAVINFTATLPLGSQRGCPPRAALLTPPSLPSRGRLTVTQITAGKHSWQHPPGWLARPKCSCHKCSKVLGSLGNHFLLRKSRSNISWSISLARSRLLPCSVRNRVSQNCVIPRCAGDAGQL